MPPCDDFPRHLPNQTPPGVLAHSGVCDANRSACVGDHPDYGPAGFQVCDTCSRHTQHILGLVNPANTVNGQPILNAAHPRRYQLLASFVQGVVVPNFQIGHSPRIPLVPGIVGVLAHTQGLITANIRSWQTQAEYQSGVLLAANHSNPPFAEFLTRVCNRCEELIQNEVWYRDNGELATTAEESATWMQPPFSSCTCWTALGMDRLPPEHHNGIPQRVETMCTDHRWQAWDQLKARKDRNDRWLRNIALRNGVLVQANAWTKRRRVNRPGYWRACRCGREIDHNHDRQPECFICMGCEGYVTNFPHWTYHNNPNQVAPAAAMPTMKLGRFLRRRRDLQVALYRPPHVG